MRLLVVHPSLNRCGGAERVCLATVKALSATGRTVHLATIERTDWQLLEERVGPVQRPSREEYLLNRIPLSSTLAHAVCTAPLFLILLVRYRMTVSFDLMVNTYGDLDYSIADISYINAIPFRLTHLFPNTTFQSPAMRLLACMFHILTLPAHKLLTRSVLLVNSTFMRDVVRKCYARDSVVIFPPVDLQRFRHKEIRNRGNIVVTITRLRLGKELELIPQIARYVKDCKFIILGLLDAGSRESLDALNREVGTQEVGDRVEVRVNQSPSVIADTLASSKVYLHTQSTEAFGISVVEAMAAGCVPVVPRSGGPWIDILGQEESMYGFSFTSPKEAARKIALLTSDEGLRREIAERAIRRASLFDSTFFESRMVRIVEHLTLSRSKTGGFAKSTHTLHPQRVHGHYQ